MHLRLRAALAASLLFAPRAALPADATRLPLDAFRRAAAATPATLQLKLTYGGDSARGLPTLLVLGPSARRDTLAYTALQPEGFDGKRDAGKPFVAAATVAELTALLDTLARFDPSAAGTTADAHEHATGAVSFTLVARTDGRSVGWSVVPSVTRSRELMRALLELFASNRTVTNELRWFGCAAAILPTDRPEDVTAGARFEMGGLRFDAQTHGFVGFVRVRNVSGRRFDAPVTLAVGTDGAAGLLDEDGQPCNVEGQWFVQLKVGDGLETGDTIERAIWFKNEDDSKFHITFHLYAGPGTR